MHSTLPLTFIVALALTCGLVLPAAGQEPGDDAAAQDLADALQLAPQHALLKKRVGKWKTEAKTFFEDPANPSVSKGTAEFKLLFGGRYLQQDYQGSFSGLPFEGLGITGYDKVKKRYVSSWIDNFETGIMKMEGRYDEKTATMTEIGVTQTVEGTSKMKNVTKQVDDDTIVFKMYMVQPDGTDFLGMQITYKRAK